LRFDFSHPKAVGAEELEEIERRVNAEVFANAEVATSVEDLESAKKAGAVALFGEKYEDKVRVVRVGEYSKELCGGTHVRSAGDIGPFVIVGERAIAAGVRRIEALTGPEAVSWIQQQRRVLTGAARSLKSAPDEVLARIEQLQAQLKEAKKSVAAASKADVGVAFAQLASKLAQHSGVAWCVADLADLDGDAVRELGDRARTLGKDLALVLFGRQEGRVPFLVIFEGAALAKGLKAGDLAKEISAVLGGGGGGRPNLAQGQGVKPDAVPEALAAANRYLAAALGA
jgi:alanyl-tRNA synthetase